jgi:hypothetical protein
MIYSSPGYSSLQYAERRNVYHHSDGFRKAMDGVDDGERGNLCPSLNANFVGQGLRVRIEGNFGIALGVCQFENGANKLVESATSVVVKDDLERMNLFSMVRLIESYCYTYEPFSGPFNVVRDDCIAGNSDGFAEVAAILDVEGVLGALVQQVQRPSRFLGASSIFEVGQPRSKRLRDGGWIDPLILLLSEHSIGVPIWSVNNVVFSKDVGFLPSKSNLMLLNAPESVALGLAMKPVQDQPDVGEMENFCSRSLSEAAGTCTDCGVPRDPSAGGVKVRN